MISIVIPHRDKHAYLGDTLASIAAQTPTLEVVIVDDGSRAPIDPITERWRDRLEIRVVRQPPRGASAARNRGLAASRGEHVLFLDADDLLAPDCLAALIAVAGEADAAIGALAEVWPSKRGFAITRFVPATIPAFPRDWLADRHVFGQCVLFRRSTIAAIGPWDESLARWQDTNYVLRLLLRSPRLVIAPTAVTLWRRGVPRAITTDASWEALASAFVNVALVIDHLRRTDQLEAHRDAVAGYYRILAGYGLEQRNLEFAIECLQRMGALDPRCELPPNDTRERLRVLGELLRTGATPVADRSARVRRARDRCGLRRVRGGRDRARAVPVGGVLRVLGDRPPVGRCGHGHRTRCSERHDGGPALCSTSCAGSLSFLWCSRERSLTRSPSRRSPRLYRSRSATTPSTSISTSGSSSSSSAAPPTPPSSS